MGEEREYGFSLTTFSPSGKLVQIEYALKRVSLGMTSLAIRAKNGVVLATEKKLPPLMLPETNEKVAHLTQRIGCVYSGMGSDYRVLLRKGRKSAADYEAHFGGDIPPSQLCRRIASIMQEYTQSGGVRPFGCSILVAGYDEALGPQLYQVDPSGSYFAWKATAIGTNMINAKTFLEKRYSDEMELEDAIHTAILTLKEGFEGEMTATNIEIGVVGEDRVFKVLTPQQVKDYITEVD